MAPPTLFRDLSGVILDVQRVGIDSGVVEEGGPLSINPDTTLARLASVVHERKSLVLSEAEFVRREHLAILIADIPFLAGEIACAAGVPCLGIGNFTWDWIYEPYLKGRTGADDLLRCIRAGYAAMDTFLRLPFSHEVDVFREVIDVPLVARRCRRDQCQILAELGLAAKDRCPRVFVAMRGSLSRDTLCAAASGGKEFCFVALEPLPPNLPSNVHRISLGPKLTFPDLVSISSVVVSKLGYGIVSEAVANGAAILYPPRSGFREDELLSAGVGRSFRATAIPVEDFVAGNWAGYLRRLLAQRQPCQALSTDGASVCAQIIAERLNL
jgi:L-arabinokinase